MIKRFLSEQLKPGMFIIDTGLALSDDSPIYSTEGEISDEEHIREVVAKGYTEAFVDTSRGRYFVENPEEESKVNVLYEVLYEGAPDDSDAFPLHDHIHKPKPKPKPKKAPQPVEEAVSVHEEVQRMFGFYEGAFDLVHEAYESIKRGNGLDMRSSERFVDTVLESLSRNSRALSTLVKLRTYDEYEFAHSLNVAVLALSFGRYLNLPEEALRCLGLGGLFHDVGKLKVPLALLNKPGKLTSTEFERVKMHCAYGREMLEGRNGLDNQVLRITHEHHERFSGNGYPDNLDFAKTSRLAVIVGMADAYDAMTSERPFKPALSQHKALSTMYTLRNKDFHPVLIDKFVRFLGVYPLGTMVKLRNGVMAVVNGNCPKNPLRPVVKTLLQSRGMWLPAQKLDLSSKKCMADKQYQIVESFSPTNFKFDPVAML